MFDDVESIYSESIESKLYRGVVSIPKCEAIRSRSLRDRLLLVHRNTFSPLWDFAVCISELTLNHRDTESRVQDVQALLDDDLD